MMFIINPRSETHKTSLFVERKIRHVDCARAVYNQRNYPGHVTVMADSDAALVEIDEAVVTTICTDDDISKHILMLLYTVHITIDVLEV